MQAIITKYLAPTDFRGTRIKASAAAGSIIIGYDYALNIEDNHKQAAVVFADKFDWLTDCRLESGTIPNGDYVHVLVANK